jgi:hypothetical protein
MIKIGLNFRQSTLVTSTNRRDNIIKDTLLSLPPPPSFSSYLNVCLSAYYRSGELRWLRGYIFRSTVVR